jgi:hypothetical protein
MKTIIQIVLALVIVILGYFIYESIMEPVRFNQEVSHREALIVQRLKDIRQLQVAHRARYGAFNSDLDSLVTFVKTDSLSVIRAIGNVPDSLTEAEAVKMGIVQRDTLWVKASDSLLLRARYPLDSIMYVPYGGGVKFQMGAGMIERGLTKIPVFEAFANPTDYLQDIYRWRVYYVRDIEAGLRVGSLVEASIDGNWE